MWPLEVIVAMNEEAVKKHEKEKKDEQRLWEWHALLAYNADSDDVTAGFTKSLIPLMKADMRRNNEG